MRVLAMLLVVAFAAPARAELAPRAALPPGARRALESEIAEARRRRPEVFVEVDRVLAGAEAAQAAQRGGLAPLAPSLRALGPDAAWALAAELVGGARRELPERARLAAAVGVIEAAGAARDPRLWSLWIAILDGPEPRFEVRRAAAEALARLDDDAAAAALVTRARAPGVAGEAVRAAMGHCRRLPVAEALVAALDARPPDAEARRLVRSLSDLGAAWAWATPALRGRAADGERLRELAARALLRLFVTRPGELRQAAATALLVVDAAGAAAWIDGARAGVDDDTRVALDRLAARLARGL
jgi:hypothetical protein